MTTIWVKPITVGEGEHAHLGPIDPDRRDRLVAGEWRAVPDSTYWRRMANSRDVRLRDVDPNPPAAEPAPVIPPAVKPAVVPPVQADKPKAQE